MLPRSFDQKAAKEINNGLEEDSLESHNQGMMALGQECKKRGISERDSTAPRSDFPLYPRCG